MMLAKGRWIGIILILSLVMNAARAQDSCRIRISLLTCSPGSELYSIFGHSALRVVDSTIGTDIVYNYGTFDFDDPDFYSKFVRGKLLYYLSQTSFPNFAYEYQMDGRSIAEQVLNLSCSAKKDIQQLMLSNMQEDQKYYKYDFLEQNCTTRLRDIINQHQGASFTEGKVLTASGMSFRDGIHFYLDRGQMNWSKLGIDLLLGSRIDREMTNRESMFLPEFLEQALDKTGNPQDSLVAEKQYPVTKMMEDPDDGISFTPMVVFSLIALLIIALSFSQQKNITRFLRGFDIAFFCIVGLLGILFLFMWLATDHKQTANNYNLLWAWPTHIVAAFQLFKQQANVRRYFLIYVVVSVLTLMAWAFLPQALNTALIPILLMGSFRSWKIYRGNGIISGKMA